MCTRHKMSIHTIKTTKVLMLKLYVKNIILTLMKLLFYCVNCLLLHEHK
jgi:hypothetical protein